ncbi:hypothetical protein BDZ89DRAFT_1139162 [Hymenopellis radicata]|nr:hypothetical protein BDZ89DRAFT_1143489 [Hymenopellis radicata]KAF9019707.1 hypothetical protein BDZ89DRAFT_1139162 [Hymenopellis radicata]
MPASEKRPRLSESGCAILKNFFDNVSQHPTREEAVALVAEIKSKLNEDYDVVKLEKFFTNRRARRNKDQPEGSTQAAPRPRKSSQNRTRHAEQNQPAEDIGALPRRVLDDLETLYTGTPHASQVLINTWAKLLRVDPIAVRFWVSNRRAQDTSNQHKLPSPAPTDYAEISPPNSSRPQLSTSRPSEVSSKLKIRIPSADVVHRNALLLEIGEGIERSIVASRSPPSYLSREEFTERFAPYEDKMLSFLTQAESGALQSEGWTRSMIKRT